MSPHPSRRSLFGAVPAVAGISLAGATNAATPDPDADLVRVCHRFAEAEYRNWYRYVTADGTEDDLDHDPDWTMLHQIEATPAMTPDGWRAKALALAAWSTDMYDDPPDDRDGGTTLLASLLRDMAAPARNAILTRCAAEFGPLPDSYDADWRWKGSPST
jgi:hypothetical protein